MKRYTRKHYNKKLVALGLACFMGIGLTSTGFAAWVMSQNAKEEVSGNVNVSTMTDASVDIVIYESNDVGVLWSLTEEGNGGRNKTNINHIVKDYVKATEKGKSGNTYTIGDNFDFDAAEGDYEGRLRVSKTVDGVVPGEDLIVRIFGQLNGTGDVDYELTASVTIPESIQAAIDAKYIVQNETKIDFFDAANATLITVDPEAATDSESEAPLTDPTLAAKYKNDFVVTISFRWGEKFGGMNPSLYYDYDYTGTSGYDKSNPKGKDISDAAMKAEMLAFWNCITGNNYTEDTFDWSASENPKFNGTFSIILEASPKEV